MYGILSVVCEKWHTYEAATLASGSNADGSHVSRFFAFTPVHGGIAMPAFQSLSSLQAIFTPLVGFVASEYAFTPGREYVYKYRSRAVTGIPGLKPQYAGLGIKGILRLQVESPSLSGIEVGSVNGEMKMPWREEIPISYSPLGETQEPLHLPFKIILKSGVVQSLEVSAEEPEWSADIKRAIASQLTLNMAKVNLTPFKIRDVPYSSSEYRLLNTITSGVPAHNFYTVEEDSIGGECKTTYTIAPLPEHLANLEELSMPEEWRRIRTETEEGKAWIVTKIRNYDECNRKPFFAHNSFVDVSPFPCSAADAQCKEFTSRTSVSRYLIRGERQNFKIERVWTEGELLVKPFATKTEKLWVVTNQTLVLEKMSSISSQIPVPVSLRPTSLLFRFPNSRYELLKEMKGEPTDPDYDPEIPYARRSSYDKEYRSESHHHKRYERSIDEKSHFKHYNEEEYPYRSSNPSFSEEYPEKYEREHRQKYKGYREEFQREYEYLGRYNLTEEEYIDEMHMYNPHSYFFYNYSSSSSMEPKIGKLKSQVLQVSKALSLLPYREMKELYEELISSAPVTSPHSKKTIKTLFLDAVAMSGTSPAVKLIKELILRKEVTGETAAELLMVLPASIKVPTVSVMRELISLAKSPVIKPHSQPHECRQVYITALLTVSNLIKKACMNPKTRISNYPITRKGLPISSSRFCSPDSPLITEAYLPFLEQEIRSSPEPWKEIVLVQAIGNTGHPYAVKIVKPFIYGLVTRDPAVRSKAIFALSRVADKYPSVVFSVLKPLFHDLREHYGVRTAAFIVLVKCQPPAVFFTGVATGTWFEPSQQVGSFVYSTLANLANSSYPFHYNMSRYAQLALPLAKPFNLGLQYSHNTLIWKYIEQLGSGSSFQTSWIGSTRSLLPRDFYIRLTNHFGGFEGHPFEMGVQLQGVQGIINSGEISLERLREALTVETRKDEPLRSSVWMKMFGGMERIFPLDRQTLIQLFEEGTLKMNGLSISEGMEVNYQKTLPLDDTIVILPSVAGLPVFFCMKAPLLVSLRGRVQVRVDGARIPPSRVHVSADLKPMLSYNHVIEAGIVCPLTKKLLISGYNAHILAAVPFKAQVDYDFSDSKLSFQVGGTTGRMPSRMDLLHFHARPFTAIKDTLDFRPLTQIQSYKFIRTQPKPRVYETVFGKKSFGIPLKFMHVTDTPFSDYYGWYEILKSHNPLTPSQVLPWPVILPSSLRPFEFKLSVDASSMETEAIRGHVALTTSKNEYKIFSNEPEIELERIKYKYPSKYYNKYSEDIQEYFNNPWSKLTECQDSESPCYTSYDSIRSLRSSRSYIPLKYEEIDVESGKVHQLHAEVELVGRVPRRYRASVIYATSKTNIREKLSVLMEREPLPGYESTPYKICINSKFQYPNFPPSTERQALLQSEMTTLGNLHFRFGEECQHAINTRIVMTRTEKQRLHAEESYESHRCREDESRGIEYSPVCKKARIQATTLNSYILDITEENVPFYVKNFTSHVDDFIKYMLYPHMTNRRVGVTNPSNKVKVVFKVLPPMSSHPYPVLDVFLLKPHENTYFKTIKVSPAAEIVFPLSAKQELVRKSLNRIFGHTYIPECKLESEVVRTFDNVTYKYPLGECWHLLAKDCSKEAPVAVLAKESSSTGKVIKVLVGPHKVLIKPVSPVSAVSGSVPEIQVLLDGQPIHLSPTEKKVITSSGSPHKKVLEFIKYKNHEIEVESPLYGVKVVTDGERIKVEVSNIYRGRMCGLCGDFNGEKVAEFKTPRDCVMVHPMAFAQTYAIKESGCSVHPRVKHIIPEEHKCLHADTYHPMGSYHEVARHGLSSSSSSSSCTRYLTKVVPRGDETCFSVKPLPECSLSCRPSRILTKEVGFHCVRGDPTELLKKAHHGIVEEMLNKEVHFSTMAVIPEACLHIP
ncbi:unnamed protein product [Darwinula stevensoni]|uniref:Vitellogenin n=1 Tax=Darwinula stevensoni TaxID=69355 RepID=A0A7R9A4I6_9CRUS|nr:unnamed protein product [Darwinula stevensoni]CAG0893655.1 unnamed protein product [Darwinula stevensoni]